MKPYVFNASVLIAWMLISFGAYGLNKNWGFIVSGALLLSNTLLVLRFAGLKR